MLDTTTRKQTQITQARHAPSYKQLEVKTNWTSIHVEMSMSWNLKWSFMLIFRNLQSKDFSIWLKYLKIILWNYSNHLILKLVAMSLDGPVSIFYFNWKFKMATTKGQSLAHDLMGEWIKKEFFDEQEN